MLKQSAPFNVYVRLLHLHVCPTRRQQNVNNIGLLFVSARKTEKLTVKRNKHVIFTFYFFSI